MPHFCPRCKRANPNEAIYCYFDGFVLQQGAGVSPIGRLAREFVFPTSGKQCRTVEEIVQTCQAEWYEARDLLRRGEFERYFGQAGRLDLARLAQDAQENPDADVGLLEFINNLPAVPNPQAPRLDLTPRRIALGALKAGEQRQMKVTILNHGKGLLQGKVAVSDGEPWLKLADGIDPNSCLVKAARDQDVTVRVDSRGLIAGQGYTGKLLVVTNGGIAEVPIRLDVKALGFTRPPFQGATSPRGMAERMRTNPKQAVPLLESGDVQRWFEANGWKYPVAGTPARGIGAVQQFFECLGLSKPPPVQLSESEVRLQVTAPDVARGQVALRTTTKKWVFAQVESDVPWLRPTKSSVSGPQQAQIGFDIDSTLMDDRPQQEGTLRVSANGGQRLALRVSVAVQFRARLHSGRGDDANGTASGAGSAADAGADDDGSRCPLPPPLPLPMSAVATVRRGAGKPAPLDWLPQPAVVPRRADSVGVRLLRPLVIGVALALVFRLLLAAPAEIFARVLVSGIKEPVPGSLDSWKHSPLERKDDGNVREEHFLKWFVVATWWIGGLAGAWLVWRRGGRPSDLLFGSAAGVAGGLPAAATAACLMVVLDGLPRAVLAQLTPTGSAPSAWGATPLWLLSAGLCWAAYGAGFAYLLCAFGRSGTRVLGALAAPLAGVCRLCGMRGFAKLVTRADAPPASTPHARLVGVSAHCRLKPAATNAEPVAEGFSLRHSEQSTASESIAAVTAIVR